MLLLATWSSGNSLLAVVLSLGAALFWALSPMFWASVGRRIGSFNVVLHRSLLGTAVLLALLPVYAFFLGRWPDGLAFRQIVWLTISGFFGMGIGDILFYEALVMLGTRRSTQVIMLSPLSAVFLGWLWLDEALHAWTLLGIAITLAGTFYAVLAGNRPGEQSREPGRLSVGGLLLAIGGALCVGVGGVTGRHAFALGEMDVFMATLVRVGSAAVVVWLVPVATGRVRKALGHLKDRVALNRLLAGTLFGPVIGMFCYLGALKLTHAGVVATVSSMSPLFILPMVAIRYRVRIRPDMIAATLIALVGVAMISWR